MAMLSWAFSAAAAAAAARSASFDTRRALLRTPCRPAATRPVARLAPEHGVVADAGAGDRCEAAYVAAEPANAPVDRPSRADERLPLHRRAGWRARPGAVLLVPARGPDRSEEPPRSPAPAEDPAAARKPARRRLGAGSHRLTPQPLEHVEILPLDDRPRCNAWRSIRDRCARAPPPAPAPCRWREASR